MARRAAAGIDRPKDGDATMLRFLHPRDDAMIELPGASDALRELAARGVRHTYNKGRLLIEQGDMAGPIYIVLSGRLRAFSQDPERGRELTYGSYGPGEYVGEMSLDGGPRAANVEAETRCECALVTRQTLQNFIAERPEFAFELLSKVIARARVATLSAQQMAFVSAYGRLRLRLMDLIAEDSNGDRFIAPRPKHRELAERIACERSMVSKLLKGLERGGYLEPRGPKAWRVPGSLPPRW
jgi:CRP/FNR family transcriptional regulator, cyclic AMP receptor protein